MQPENSEVSELMRKSRNSWRISGESCGISVRTSSANAASRWKWSWLLSPSYSFIITSQSARTLDTSSASMALKSVV